MTRSGQIAGEVLGWDAGIHRVETARGRETVTTVPGSPDPAGILLAPANDTNRGITTSR